MEKSWVDLAEKQKIETLRACVRLLALAVSSGQEYFLEKVVEKLSPEGKGTDFKKEEKN